MKQSSSDAGVTRRHDGSAWLRSWVWLLPGPGVCWAAWNLRGGYFFYDDWAMIDRVLHTTPVEGMTTGYNGHLWVLQDWVYRIQVFWFGVEENTFIRGVFLCSLFLMHLSLAALLHASGLSRASSMLLGGLLTYLGAGAENIMWPVQLSPTLSVAAGAAAAAIALSRVGEPRAAPRAATRTENPLDSQRSRTADAPAMAVPAPVPVPEPASSPSLWHIVAVGVLSMLAVAIDSAIAFMSVTFAAIVTLLAWRGNDGIRSNDGIRGNGGSGGNGAIGGKGGIGGSGRLGGLGRFAVAPALAALGLWTLFADRGPSFPADFETRAAFAVRLLLHAGGGVFGLGQAAGAIILIASIALIAIGFRCGYLDRRSRIILAAGSASALIVAAALTAARGGIAGLDFNNGSRYLHNVIIPITLAAAPALAATGRGLAEAFAMRRGVGAGAGAAGDGWRRAPVLIGWCLILAACLLGLAPKQGFASTFKRYNAETRAGVAAAAAVIRQGCPSGARPDPASTPLDFIGPQISTQLIRELLDRGLLAAPPSARPNPAILARMCGN